MKNTKFLLPMLLSAAAVSFAPALVAADLTWAGTGDNNTWDTTSENWTSDGAAATFTSGDGESVAGDNVAFTADAAGKDVVVSENVTAGTIAVSGGEYTFSANSTENPETVSGSALTVSGGSATFDLVTNISGALTLSGGNSAITFNEGATISSFSTSSSESGTGRSLTIAEGATVTITTINNGWGLSTLDVNGTLEVGTFTYASGNSTNNITGTGTINAGSLTLKNAGTYVFGVDGSNPTLNVSNNASIGDTDYSGYGTVSATFNGTTKIEGTLSVSYSKTTVNFNGATTTLGSLRQTGGTIAIGDGTNTAVVTTGQFVGASTGSTAGTLTINANSVLNVTGESNSISGNEGSFQISHWGATQTVNVNGVLNVASAVVTRDGTGVLNINGGGEANFTSGLTFSHNYGTIEVNLAEGGRINVGSGGIGDSSFATLNLNGGTIGSLAESWSSTRALSLGGAVTIDTEKQTVSSTTYKAEATGEASSVTLSGVISGAGSLEKIGEGTLTLSNENTYMGGTTISKGTLVAENASALGEGGVSINGGQLSITEGITLNTDTISIVLSDTYLSTAAIDGLGSLVDGTEIELSLDETIANAILESETGLSFQILSETLAGNSSGIDADSFSVGGTSSGDLYELSYASGVLTITAVPEPSAFGLLAGLGALALVAARRRRSRKAA